jgi:uncharacterized protein (DUF1501 family)
LRRTALGLAGAAPACFGRPQEAAPVARPKVLVAIFQRGAADGLNMVVPHGESAYYRLRRGIAVPRPTSNAARRDGAALELDGFFGLHPALAPLQPLYAARELAIIHAVGSPHPTRSHIDAQEFMESGAPGMKSRDGWLNRLLAEAPGNASPLRAVAVSGSLPGALRGTAPAFPVHSTSEEHAQARALLQAIRRRGYSPAAGVEYPRSPLASALLQIAQLIKSGAGVEAAFAESGGWDHHVAPAGVHTLESPLAMRLREFAQALSAFRTDLGSRMEDVVVVTMSEFGRTAAGNASGGTDHGHANAMFALGGPVRGGKVYGPWPGLEREQLHPSGGLALGTDFRDVLSELAAWQAGKDCGGSLFPGHSAVPVGVA